MQADLSGTWIEEKKQMIYEMNHLKSEIRTKDFEVEELKKQVAELKLKLEAKIKENEKNLRCVKEAKRQLGN